MEHAVEERFDHADSPGNGGAHRGAQADLVGFEDGGLASYQVKLAAGPAKSAYEL